MPKFVECLICGNFHKQDWNGDCREPGASYPMPENPNDIAEFFLEDDPILADSDALLKAVEQYQIALTPFDPDVWLATADGITGQGDTPGKAILNVLNNLEDAQ